MSAIYDGACETSVMYDCPYRLYESNMPVMAIPYRKHLENHILSGRPDLRLSTLNISY
jgi:hypothetical protein